MTPRSPFRPALASLLAVALLIHAPACGSAELSLDTTAAPSADDSSRSYSFDTPSKGAPTGWSVATTNAEPNAEDGHWQVLPDETAPTPPCSLALVDARGHSGPEFNLCWDPSSSFGDVDLTVAVHACDGAEDQGGGPAWRIADADHDYTARWNPLEYNLRVYSVVAGNRVELDSATVYTDASAWHTIRIRQVGDTITCWLDGRERLHAVDDKLTEPGAVGVWTKADATTRFDDLVVRSASEGPP